MHHRGQLMLIQRMLGQVWGTVGAVMLRMVFVGIVTVLLRIPFLRLTGGVLLVWIAVKLVRPAPETTGPGCGGASFWEAMWIIVAADITMSLDNVLAIAAAARGNLLLVGLGIATSIPVVVWGSGLLARLMNRYVWIIWLGGGILGYVAGDMMLEDPIIVGWLGDLTRALEHPLPLALAAGLVALGWWSVRRIDLRT